MNRPAPPFIIDIEASGLGTGSYPIEVGLALQPDRRFCSLIKPAPGWVHWDEHAETVHGISRETLNRSGRPVAEVAHELNNLLEDKVVFSDAWGIDNPWVTELFARAGVPQRFTISTLEMILSEAQVEIWRDTRDKIINELDLRRHRASNDAHILQETYLKTLAMTTEESVESQSG